MEEGVFRGIHVDLAPLRLSRGQLQPAVEPPAESGLTLAGAYQEALQGGFEEGLRQGRQQGRAEGHDEGVRSGRGEAARQAKEEAERAVAAATAALREQGSRLDALLDAWGTLFMDGFAAAEDEMVAVCYETICRLVAEVAFDPATVHATLSKVLSAAREEPRILLHLHPADALLLDACGLVSAPGQVVTWRADPSVGLGGCIVRTAGGGLDLRLETTLAGCRSALLRAREARGGSTASGAKEAA